MGQMHFKIRKEAERLENIVLRETGYLPSIFREGKGYTVVVSEIGTERLEELYTESLQKEVKQ